MSVSSNPASGGIFSDSEERLCTAPINLNVVPPNLRQFIAPSVRRLYIDETPVEEASETNGANGRPEPPSPTSELSRLRAENIALD